MEDRESNVQIWGK